VTIKREEPAQPQRTQVIDVDDARPRSPVRKRPRPASAGVKQEVGGDAGGSEADTPLDPRARLGSADPPARSGAADAQADAPREAQDSTPPAAGDGAAATKAAAMSAGSDAAPGHGAGDNSHSAPQNALDVSSADHAAAAELATTGAASAQPEARGVSAPALTAEPRPLQTGARVSSDIPTSCTPAAILRMMALQDWLRWQRQSSTA
jgi:hypothetical protein